MNLLFLLMFKSIWLSVFDLKQAGKNELSYVRNKSVKIILDLLNRKKENYIHLVNEQGEQFSDEVDGLLKELSERYSMDRSIETARLKMEGEKLKNQDNDYKRAGILINLYTHSDDISLHQEDKTLYSILNHELRRANPDIKWRKYELLLNRALNIIGQETYQYLFRGERCCRTSVPDEVLEGSSFDVRAFWSTTLDPYVTEFFGGAEYAFYIIKNAEGVNVKHVSASVTDVEKEVLIQSSKKYKLEKKISDEKEKRETFKSIKLLHPDFDFSEFNPEKIYVLVALKGDQGHDEL